MHRLESPTQASDRPSSLRVLPGARYVTTQLLVLCAWVLLSAPSAACTPIGEGRASASTTESCRMRLLVGLHVDADEELVADLATVAGAHLEVLRALLPYLYLVELGATGADSECAAAAERLARDARVRSVEIDARRQRLVM